MTLTGSGTSIRGSGVETHDPAGDEATFIVAGTSERVPGMAVTFEYSDGSREGFIFAQDDMNHLTLQNMQRTLSFVRQ